MSAVRRAGWIALVLVIAAGAGWGAYWFRGHIQRADETYDVSIADPTFARNGPRVCIDEAHNNLATASGRYRPFAELLTNDGYQVRPLSSTFSGLSLSGCHVLVVANALGARFPFLPGAPEPAFTGSEIAAVRQWVLRGGALLLAADPRPAGAANAALAETFGVRMTGGRTENVSGSVRYAPDSTWILFTRDSGSQILNHPITSGRDSAQLIRRVVSFTGQSLTGPAGSTGLLQLGPGSTDRMPSGALLPVSGRAHAVALDAGRGRVVIVGDAAMITALVSGDGKLSFGMSRPDTDNRQLALNMVFWLSRGLR